MIPKDGITRKYFKEAFRRRLWYVVIPFFVLAMSTVVYCIKAPRLYKSSALLVVQPQEVPSEYVRTSVTADVRIRLKNLKAQVLSQSELEGIVRKYNLYSEVLAEGTMAEAVSVMREDLNIEVVETSLRIRQEQVPTTIEVTYVGSEPVKVRNVTVAIADLFTDRDRILRELKAAETVKFLEHELERRGEDVRLKEAGLREFKEEHMGLLPDDMNNNYQILTQLQQQLDSLNASVQQAEDRRVLLQTEIGRLEAQLADVTPASSAAGLSNNDLSTLGLEELQQRLKTLKSRYSDRHPDVARLSAMVARLEREEETVSASGSDGWSRAEPSGLSSARKVIMVQREGLLNQLRLVEKEIQQIVEEIRETSRDIEKYRRRIEAGPRIEQMYLEVRRGYEQASDSYQNLLQQKMQAEIATDLERKQKGEQLKIIEYPSIPKKPSKPQTAIILFIGFNLALATGLGLAYLREYLDQTCWSTQELETIVELPVLATIPVITTDRTRRWSRFKRLCTLCLLLVMGSTLVYALFLLLLKSHSTFLTL
jgi:polysaccharide chain length determinant protein (PEP-CTERM system associated)